MLKGDAMRKPLSLPFPHTVEKGRRREEIEKRRWFCGRQSGQV
jgi:hypothetical protein